MRKSILFKIVILFSLKVNPLAAQIELGTNPLGILSNNPDLSIEYVLRENLGIEVMGNLEFGRRDGLFNTNRSIESNKRGYRLRLTAKYYFREVYGADRWFTGIYLGPRRINLTEFDSTTGSTFEFTERFFALGFIGGIKWVGEKGFIFEISGRAGRAFNNGTDPSRISFSNLTTDSGIDLSARVKIGQRF